MNIIPLNSQPETPHEEAKIIRQGPIRNHHLKKDSDSTLFSKDGTPNFQSLYSSKEKDEKQNPQIKEEDR